MECPDCGSSSISKNGHRKGKQNHICSDCHRQFIDAYEPHLGRVRSLQAGMPQNVRQRDGIPWH